VEIRHFKYFLAVAEASHFTRAAFRLNIAVPTLSRQIKEMEEALGVQLFVRAQRQATLTEAGKALLTEARDVVYRFDIAQEQAQRAGRDENGHIEIGYVASAVFNGALQRHTTTFKKAFPGVQLSLREYPMVELPRLVAEGRIDLAYVRAPMVLPAELKVGHLDEEGYVLALPCSHPLTSRHCIDPGDLGDELFILPEQVSGTITAGSLGAFVPKLGPQPGSLVAVLALVALGQGVSIVPKSAAVAVSLPGVTFRPVNGLEEVSWLGLVSRRHEQAQPIRNYLSLLG